MDEEKLMELALELGRRRRRHRGGRLRDLHRRRRTSSPSRRSSSAAASRSAAKELAMVPQTTSTSRATRSTRSCAWSRPWRTTTTSRRSGPTSTSTRRSSRRSPASAGPGAVLILGIDPGSLHTGYGLVERQGSTLTAVDAGRFSCPRDLDLPARLAHLASRPRASCSTAGRRTSPSLETPFHGMNVALADRARPGPRRPPRRCSPAAASRSASTARPRSSRRSPATAGPTRSRWPAWSACCSPRAAKAGRATPPTPSPSPSAAPSGCGSIASRAQANRLAGSRTFEGLATCVTREYLIDRL